MLNDAREMIRNECLLLLIDLTAQNQEIQKIVAYESAFEKLFAIIQTEDTRTSGRGSIVVQDCLQLICTLLQAIYLHLFVRSLLDISNRYVRIMFRIRICFERLVAFNSFRFFFLIFF